MKEWMNEWTNEWNAKMKEWKNEWRNEGMKEWMNEWMNENHFTHLHTSRVALIRHIIVDDDVHPFDIDTSTEEVCWYLRSQVVWIPDTLEINLNTEKFQYVNMHDDDSVQNIIVEAPYIKNGRLGKS